jgi:hypothetical protein
MMKNVKVQQVGDDRANNNIIYDQNGINWALSLKSQQNSCLGAGIGGIGTLEEDNLNNKIYCSKLYNMFLSPNYVEDHFDQE